jgi:ribonucleotide reductase beta subunit family protein with ferritin-like domain
MVDLTYMNKTLALRVFILFLSCFIKKKNKMMGIFVVGNYDLEGLTFFSFFFFFVVF